MPLGVQPPEVSVIDIARPAANTPASEHTSEIARFIGEYGERSPGDSVTRIHCSAKLIPIARAVKMQIRRRTNNIDGL